MINFNKVVSGENVYIRTDEREARRPRLVIFHRPRVPLSAPRHLRNVTCSVPRCVWLCDA
jgi:hypothetical protein